MAITNGYITRHELRQYIEDTEQATYTDSQGELLDLVIEAVSRWIDNELPGGMRFYASNETRYYTPEFPDLLWVDDLLSITTLKSDDDWDGTYEVTFATTDYILEPRNAALDNEPYRQIRTNFGTGDLSFPVGVRDGVEIVGSFGYSSTAPTVIKQATLLLANRLWRRKDAVFGVAGTAALGVTTVQAQITRDSDIVDMIHGISERGFYR